jgi:diguanylate cyclase (GGDEF)-like protein/PAS domain S-box-containing protein
MLLHPDMDKNTLARFDAFCANPDHLFDEIFQLRHRDGSSVWLHSRGIAIRDPGGRAVRLLGAHNDITALKRVENALLRGKADLTALLAKSSEANAWLEMAEQISRIGHWRYNVADQTLIWSNELYRIHGVTCETYSPTIESAVGFSHPDDFDRVQSIITGAIVDAQPFEFSTRVISADGDLRHVNCRGVTRPAADGKVGMIVGVMADVTEQRQTEQALRDANARLQQLVNVDSLTGLANRRRFDQGLSQEWRRAARERTPLSLVLVDIDRFKEFNDRYGHLAGDDCLRRVAGVLAEHCRRSGDLVARYGGEEMVLLLPTTTPAGAEIVARACRSAARSPQALASPPPCRPWSPIFLIGRIWSRRPTANSTRPNVLAATR